MYIHSNYWGDADVDHSQTIGGDTAKLLRGYIPPLFRHPWFTLIGLLDLSLEYVEPQKIVKEKFGTKKANRQELHV